MLQYVKNNILLDSQRRNARNLDFERAELGHRKESHWNIWPSDTIVERLEALSS